MWSRRAAWESMTTRRRLRAGPFLAGVLAPSPAEASAGFLAGDFVPAASAFGWAACFGAAFGFPPSPDFPSVFAAAFFGASLVFVAAPPSPEFFSAASASDSSTLDWAAFASMPAALSAARRSLLVRPCAFAISCTRFFAIYLLGLRLLG